KGSPVDFVFPTEGVTAINQPIAILKTAKNVKAAQAFVDFQLSKDAAEQSVTQAYFPIMKGVTPPAGYPAMEDLKIIEADSKTLLESTEDTKKRFADIYGG
ncbi:MAG: extracellular solute-binding protein, partial [Rhodospirillum sp.]|nr:extracellular solute-binding protein [Rhodospirillum sp.]